MASSRSSLALRPNSSTDCIASGVSFSAARPGVGCPRPGGAAAPSAILVSLDPRQQDRFPLLADELGRPGANNRIGRAPSVPIPLLRIGPQPRETMKFRNSAPLLLAALVACGRPPVPVDQTASSSGSSGQAAPYQEQTTLQTPPEDVTFSRRGSAARLAGQARCWFPFPQHQARERSHALFLAQVRPVSGWRRSG